MTDKKQFTLTELIEVVYIYAAEQRRVKETPAGKDNITRWVKAKLYDLKNLKQ